MCYTPSEMHVPWHFLLHHSDQDHSQSLVKQLNFSKHLYKRSNDLPYRYGKIFLKRFNEVFLFVSFTVFLRPYAHHNSHNPFL